MYNKNNITLSSQGAPADEICKVVLTRGHYLPGSYQLGVTKVGVLPVMEAPSWVPGCRIPAMVVGVRK